MKMAETPHFYNSKTCRKGYQLHHIVPTHANGPDIAENCICLSVEDHAKAHFILHKVYGSYYDLCAYKMRKGKNQEAFDALRKANVEKMRKEKKGRFDSANQAKCGKKTKESRAARKNHIQNFQRLLLLWNVG
uniref:putative HNH homing endonuclease n=1 Tax=Coelastrella saipanensis TaxID=152631 RepID=UPI0010C563C2|nr:putative HNH homing endonuclease [Coelastrella saipanensis]AVV61583.1 putative HNH homing endonuclease [Coelastrella saipanensis]